MYPKQFALASILHLPLVCFALQWQSDQVGYNLNLNETATQPRDYWGEWQDHSYYPSPPNWRLPFYVLTLDRYQDGDPTNNEANGTVFEHNWMSNQFRFGGDAKGLENDLDYIQGFGIKAIYLTGSPFLNMPWSGDGYGPLDFTLLDRHHGSIEDWRSLVNEIHKRGMYVIFDNTMATMGDLIAFGGYVNQTTPFNWDEYDPIWKSDRRYHDFEPGSERDLSCQYPRMWGQDGLLLTPDILSQMHGCRESEFDLYGDIQGTGAYPSYIDQLSKFASVQDRLREWRPDVLEKIKIMSCIQIAMLDIDGFRMDKALQTTPDAMAEFTDYQRECAKRYGKDNFMVVGEVVGDPRLAAVYFGRGKEPTQYNYDTSEVVATSNYTPQSEFIRDYGLTAIDGAAFHYDIYGSLTRFLGLDGPWGEYGVDWVNLWNRMLEQHDLVNANTGLFDPRHMYGTTDQDVFRWPALANGTQRQLLGFMVTMLELPGIPMVLWGEEQEYYVLENLAPDYVFGRTPMGSSRAWQLHGCYLLGEEVYVDMPFNKSGFGCYDDSVSLDHRDPSHPLRNVLKRMFELRQQYPSLNDGYNLTTLSNQTYNIYLPGSGGLPSPTGIWSVYRGRSEMVQDFSGQGQGNQGVWFVYSNKNATMDYAFDCSSAHAADALIAPWPEGTTVKNLFYPYEEYDLQASSQNYGIEGSSDPNGCLPSMVMRAWDWKVLVPIRNWEAPAPTITRFIPGHDARLLSEVAQGQQATIAIEVHFDQRMDCESVKGSLSIASTTEDRVSAELDTASVACQPFDEVSPQYVGQPATAWRFVANLTKVSDGVHTIVINNATNANGTLSTGAVDRFMFRVGQADNPMVFPVGGNYTKRLLHQSENGSLYVQHRAPGADRFRYSLTWASSWSQWYDYTGENFTLQTQNWTGTEAQRWHGDHVVVNYWSSMTGSSEHMQHGDLNRGNLPARRWPHAFAEGKWNQYGYDGGLFNKFKLVEDGIWMFDLVAEWPSDMIVNVWGMNSDGAPDKSAAFGDVDGDHVLDWLPPQSLADNVINMTRPPTGYLGWKTLVNDGNYNYHLEPIGSVVIQAIIAASLFLVPLLSGAFGIWVFMTSFYRVKFNEIGVDEKRSYLDFLKPQKGEHALRQAVVSMFNGSKSTLHMETPASMAELPRTVPASPERRRVLIATMEYDIEDWGIKVKIGGLGVMASLMGKNLGHQDLVWIVPCVGDIDYPVDEIGESMSVKVLGVTYDVQVQYHRLRNITYVLLDAPIFRQQTKAEPYPARMDDLRSAIYYSAWNQCIAESIIRFDVDLYHINDYHGAVAPLYLLPSVIPCCLSLHNAEFQGLWSLRTIEEKDEICLVYNLDKEVVDKYVQFGEVFNLLHAAASYLRMQQKGFGAVGVSKKYGKRSLMRYPIFWGLDRVGSLPNPDPSDTAPLEETLGTGKITIDLTMERERGQLRTRAQEWAGLTIDPEAELFVFVGRWSMQKGIDLIADVFFSVLQENPKTQLICVGPVIDLYGKFAALKLEKMMEMFPRRVFSRPEFTVLPPYVFSGAEFALIPSRDEPFGLVAVEFGRKGALGIGARVGGLGQMPGWWFTVESTSTKHLMTQFKSAINSALHTKQSKRAEMRARSLLQRFPVAQWVADLDRLQSTAIHVSHQQQKHGSSNRFRSLSPSIRNPSSNGSPVTSPRPGRGMGSPLQYQSPVASSLDVPFSSPPGRALIPSSPTIGSVSDIPVESQSVGPGHAVPRGRRKLHKQMISSRSSSLEPPSDAPHGLGVAQNDPLVEARLSILSSQNERYDGIPEEDERGDLEWQRYSDSVMPATPEMPPRSPTRSLAPSPSLQDVARQELLESPFDSVRDLKRLSLTSVVSDRKDFKLQNVEPFFTDPKDIYYRTFDKMLEKVDPKSSESSLCIEQFLVKSEKDWFKQLHRAKLGRSSGTPSRPGTPRSATFASLDQTGGSSVFSLRLPWTTAPPEIDTHMDPSHEYSAQPEDFELPNEYTVPNRLKRLMQTKIGDWQIYCLLLALGQIMSANSYQISLLTGDLGETTSKLYILASIYLVSTLGWWLAYRTFRAVYILSAPFILYGLAFLILGIGPWVSNSNRREWIYNISTAIYGVASASGSFYFALNFGTEGGTATQAWAFRACVIQGTQQLYMAFLWYWGSALTNGSSTNHIARSGIATAITMPIGLSMWVIGVLVFLGLPSYYRNQPGRVPSFYKSILHRKVVLCFFMMVLLQNYFLSGPYNRNWRYLWSSEHAPFYAIFILILLFFIGIWAVMLYILGTLSKFHSWIIPIFAIGLGAPRWCQMLWSTSNIGLYIPWVLGGSDTAGALLGRGLWLWLGVLDALQGVGFGMLLLQTLTRFHIAFVLIAAQAIGSLTTIVARASAPNRLGPGPVFPDFSLEGISGLRHAWFWVALVAQLLICAGFFKAFRKEQLFKP